MNTSLAVKPYIDKDGQVSLFNPESISKLVSNLMLSVNMCASAKGFNYLRDAVTICIMEPEAVQYGITKYLYPILAKRYGTRIGNIEKNIRYIITESEYSTTEYKALFGKDRFHFTNKEFIYSMAEYIRNNYL